MDESTPSQDGDTPYDPTRQLIEDRRRNDLKLKGRFEKIFNKYERDFTRIGDEIDLETGHIIVNNGHLAYMQNERDVGSSASSRIVKSVNNELEDEEEEEGDDEEEDVNTPIVFEGEDSEQDELSIPKVLGVTPSRQNKMLRFPDDDESDGHAGDNEDSETERDADYAASPNEEEEEDQEDAMSFQDPTNAMTQGILNSVPSLQDSLSALAPRPLEPGQQLVIDPAAIQALGQNIAEQIAQFLRSSANYTIGPQIRSPWSVPPLPRVPSQSYGNAIRQGLVSPSPFASSPGAGESLWAAPEKRRPYKKRKLQHIDNGVVPKGLRLSIEEGVNHATRPATADSPASFMQNANQSFRSLALGISGIPTQGNTGHNPQTREVSVDPFAAYTMPPADDSDTAQTVRGQKKNLKRFTEDEDMILKRLREVEKMTWQQIRAHLPSRTETALQSRYSRVLRHLPLSREPHIKREIVEILDEDDENVQPFSTNTPARPGFRVIPMSPYQPFAPRAAGQPPMAQQGLPQNYPGPNPNQYPASHAPPGHAPMYPQAPGPPWQYPTYDTDAPPPRKKRKNPKVKEYAPRYRTFDSTQGNGQFAVLRADKPRPMAPVPEQKHMLGPVTSRSGAFGVLKMGKPLKPKKAAKTKTLRTVSHTENAAAPFGAIDAAPQGGQMNQDSQSHTPFAYGTSSNAQPLPWNLPYFDRPQTTIAYPNAAFPAPEETPEPNELAQNSAEAPVEIEDDSSTGSDMFMTPREMTLEPSPMPSLHAMSPTPLPTPPSDGSADSAGFAAGMAKVDQANTDWFTHREPPSGATRLPRMSPVSLNHIGGPVATPSRAAAIRKSLTTPATPRDTSVRGTPARATPFSQRKKAQPRSPVVHDDSGDELA